MWRGGNKSKVSSVHTESDGHSTPSNNLCIGGLCPNKITAGNQRIRKPTPPSDVTVTTGYYMQHHVMLYNKSILYYYINICRR